MTRTSCGAGKAGRIVLLAAALLAGCGGESNGPVAAFRAITLADDVPGRDGAVAAAADDEGFLVAWVVAEGSDDGEVVATRLEGRDRPRGETLSIATAADATDPYPSFSSSSHLGSLQAAFDGTNFRILWETTRLYGIATGSQVSSRELDPVNDRLLAPSVVVDWQVASGACRSGTSGPRAIDRLGEDLVSYSTSIAQCLYPNAFGMASLSVEILPSSTRSGRTIPVEPPIGVFGGGGYSELASAAGGLASRGEEALLVWRANGGVSGPLGAVWIDPERASSLALEIESELWRSPQVATDGQDYLVTGLAPAEAGALGVELRASRLAPGATSLDDPRGTKVAAGSLIYSHRIVALGPGRYVVVYLDFEAEDRQRLLLASVTTVGGVSGGEPVVLAEGALRSFAVAANRSTLLVVSSQALDEERFSIDSFAFPLPLR